MSVACVIIAGGTRTDLLDREVIPSVVAQGFDEILVCGEHHDGQGYRYLPVAALTHSTVDALVKRDAGTVGTNADWVAYLSDDHRIRPDGESWGVAVRRADMAGLHVIVPERYAQHPEQGLIRIPNGEEGGYCAGHGGLFRREVIRNQPWCTQPHDRLWDLYASQRQQDAGYRFASAPIAIEDMETEREPWL